MTLDGPPNALILSADGTRFYLRDRTYEQIEVIDVAARRSIDYAHVERRHHQSTYPQLPGRTPTIPTSSC